MDDTEYVSKEAALACFHDWIDSYGHEHSADEMTEYQRIEDWPADDVVARDCYDRILAENDTMREMLARTGKKCGDSMDEVPSADVRPVVKGTWKTADSYAGPGLMNLRCSVCGGFGGTWKDNTLPSMLYNFCPNCGADMEGNENG